MPHLQRNTPLRLLPPLFKVVAFEWDKAIAKRKVPPDTGVILHFHAPSDSAETGGYPSITFGIDAKAQLLYINESSYVGIPPSKLLTKTLEFDFKTGLVRHRGRDFPLVQRSELFENFQKNFCLYYAARVFEVKASPL